MVENARKPALSVDPEARAGEESPHQRPLTQEKKLSEAEEANLSWLRRVRQIMWARKMYARRLSAGE